MATTGGGSEYDDEGYRRDLPADVRDFQRIYGPWDPFTPERARDLFDPLGVPWWVAGGWALDVFTGVHRFHEDLDIGLFRKDLPVLREAVAGRYHVWSASSGALTPLVELEAQLPESSVQVWLREHALAPWRVDVVLTPDVAGRWVFRRDPAYVADLDEVTTVIDGVRYARPEIALAFKAKAARPKDEADFEAALPLLEEGPRRWLADFLDRVHPGHPWRDRLA